MRLLFDAVKSGDLEAVKTHLEAVPVGRWDTDNAGNTPLHIAFKPKYNKALNIFYEFDITSDVFNQRNNDGYSILHYAAQQKNLDWTKKILSCPEIDIDTENLYGNTPFMLSVINNELKIAELLKDKNADINHSNHKKWTALHFTASKGLLECSEQLIKWGAKLDMKNNFGATPLIRASINGNVQIVECLLKHDVDVNSLDINKWTSVHHAAKRGHINILRLLLERKAEVDGVNESGNTPLIIACLNNSPEAVGILLDHHADVNFRSNQGTTALDIATREKHNDCTSIIEKKIREKHLTLSNTYQAVGILRNNDDFRDEEDIIESMREKKNHEWGNMPRKSKNAKNWKRGRQSEMADKEFSHN
nr:alpha-latrotoxin-Lhe1a-like [Leptinotarsa decemlineata]XP_023013185.1 alpha-latrotoxin-Lhe1a-like [Leptinotarsa decemlineata]